MNIKSISSYLLLYSLLAMISCSSNKSILVSQPTSNTPDYNDLNYWASHPAKKDFADLVPKDDHEDIKPSPDIDIFFVHPTTYTGKKIEGRMNALLTDEKLNQQTDKSTIQFQASIFNRVGNVYAPRYRQAHLSTFYSKDRKAAKEVFDLAYSDVATAFDYYIQFENKGKPFIIASHSQGTVHASRLIRDKIDGKTLQKQLVTAYLVGMPVKKNAFENITPCQSPTETGCFTSWRAFQTDYIPDNALIGDSLVVQNPITWTTDEAYAPKEESKGAVLRNFNKIFPQIVDAQIHNGILWISKPKFPWSFLFTRKNYHVVDMNFFYKDIQHNCIDRVKAYSED